jgi:zinc transporter ZupT
MISFTLLLCVETIVVHRGMHNHNHSHGHGLGVEVHSVEGTKADEAGHGEHVHAHVCSEHVAQVVIQAAGTVDPVKPAIVKKASDSEGAGSENALVKVVAGDEVEVKAQAHTESRVRALARAYVFIIAISLHSILDGLSIGAASEVGSFTSAVIAVVSHKAFDGLALGIPVFLSGMPWRLALGSLVLCASMTPIGIGIGMGATYSGSSSQVLLAQGLILGFAGGSYLYVALTELLPTALAHKEKQALKLAFFTVGWVCMAIIAGYMPHEDGAHAEEEEAHRMLRL